MRKVCKSCKIFVKENECPLCKGAQFTESWKGRMFIQDASKSEVAKKIGANVKGEYAVKVR